jgi:hypothetical protein
MNAAASRPEAQRDQIREHQNPATTARNLRLCERAPLEIPKAGNPCYSYDAVGLSVSWEQRHPTRGVWLKQAEFVTPWLVLRWANKS